MTIATGLVVAVILLCVVGIVYGVALGRPHGWVGAGLSLVALLCTVLQVRW